MADTTYVVFDDEMIDPVTGEIIDQIVLSLTARGLTTGEIAAHFDEVYGAKASRDTISRITEKVTGELAEWASRPLDALHPVIFVDAIVVKARDGQVRNTAGVTTAGEREILGIWAGDGGEGARFWLQVFTKLKNRGVEDVLIAVCDGLKGLPEAINPTWEKTVVHQCIVHLIHNSFRYAGRQHRDAIVKALKPVDTASSEQAAKDRFGGVRSRVGAALPGDHQALAHLLGGVRAVPRIRRRDPPSDLHDQRDRVDQREIPAGRPSAGALPERASSIEVFVSRDAVP